MISNFSRIATVCMSAFALMVGATTASAQKFGDTITTFEAAVEASSLAEDWLDGKLPNPKVTYDGPPITYRYASYLPSVAGVEKLNKRALEQLEREANGKIKFKQFHSQALHPQREGFTAARDGVADYTACFMIYEPTSFNMLHGLTLPFLFDDASAATMTDVALYPKYFKKEYENMGVYMGRGMITTPYNVIGNHKYETLADLKGSKIRAGGRMQSEALKALGAVPINVPSSEAYTSLQRGLVDGVAMNDPVFPIFKLHEVSKYHNDVSLFSVNLEYCMNPKFFDSLPGDLKDVYSNWAQKTTLMLAQLFYERQSRRVRQAVFVKNGIELVKPSAAERAKWEELVVPVTENWVIDNEKAGRPAKAFLAEVKATRDKFAAMSWNDQFQQVIDNPVKGIVDY
ncbi:MAG: TRAP-type C4-dicarboxylate transport system substrate-binding protein [Alphaproteobacteria bacterium]|jgi:TRAP-type C4-dicarboxylate transport system substrate-binding protein